MGANQSSCEPQGNAKDMAVERNDDEGVRGEMFVGPELEDLEEEEGRLPYGWTEVAVGTLTPRTEILRQTCFSPDVCMPYLSNLRLQKEYPGFKIPDMPFIIGVEGEFLQCERNIDKPTLLDRGKDVDIDGMGQEDVDQVDIINEDIGLKYRVVT